MPEISVVLGTWNRLEALQSCIACVRDSVDGIDYEIIVVDGGSTDGTLEWLDSQDDIITVRQGKLVGACRAYTAGFRLVRAPFVVHINDDDEVQGDCIKKAYQYMLRNPDVGQVAFAFDLYDPRYHFDHVFGKLYANKGMTRRHLGDRAGWWPDTFYTYGGDCELSCRIMEMGYKVIGLRDCRAHDLKTHDELRDINNPPGKPDSNKFYSLRKGIDSPGPEQRVLHVALNYGTDNQPALERALRSIGPYRQIDWRKLGSRAESEIIKQCYEFDPAIVFMQLQQGGVVSPKTAQAIGNERTLVNWSGDVRFPLPEWYFGLGRYVITLVTNGDWVKALQDRGLDADYLQIGFNQEIFHPWGSIEEREPIVFLGNHYGNVFPLSRDRYRMVAALDKRYGDKFGVYGTGWPFPTERLDWYREAAVYRGCKIAVGISQFDYWRYTSDRLFRAMGSGAFYLTKYYPGIDRDFERGEHLDTWETLEELTERVDYYLEHDEEREQIAHEGSALVHERHTWLDRIHQLKGMVGIHPWK